MQTSFIKRVLIIFCALITLTTAIATQKPISNNAKALLNLHDLQTEYSMHMEEHNNVMKQHTGHLEDTINSLNTMLDLKLSDTDTDTLFEMLNQGAVEMIVKVLSDISAKVEGGADMLEEARQVLMHIKGEMKDLEVWSEGFKRRVGKAQWEFGGRRESCVKGRRGCRT
jgi:hypothetical protein